ncbi:hypothetical protein ACFPU0_22950 [Pseudomonas sp. GCM10022186]|uniref:hypothetical protein n=1 Tax=Pseudomonas sp. GCM10022186 TaxID=3252650 RepID=UPI0036132E2B
MSDGHVRWLFLSAAWFNLLAGLPLLVAMRSVAGVMGLEITPTSTLFIQISMGVVLVFALAYWMIARDPLRYRPYIPLGIVLKLLVVLVIHGHWLAGNLDWPLAALAIGDIVYALLFWRYYQRTALPAPLLHGRT